MIDVREVSKGLASRDARERATALRELGAASPEEVAAVDGGLLLAAIGDEDLGAIKEGLLLSMEGLELALDPDEGMSVVSPVPDEGLGDETPAETLDAQRIQEETEVDDG